MQRLDRASLLARIKDHSVTANIHDSEMINDKLAKVVCTFNTVATRSEMYLAVAHLFKGLAAPIEGSFRTVQTAGLTAMVGFVAANVEVKPYEKAEVAKMKVMASNLLMDKDDESLWQVNSSGNEKYLVRQGHEDLSELVVLAKVRQHNVPRLDNLVTTSIQKSEYVSYVHPELCEVKFGYVLASDDDKLEVLPRDEDDSEEISTEMVIESAFLKGSDTQVAVEAGANPPANASDKASMKSYYKEMFSYAPEYYSELEKIIDSHSGI